MATTSVLVADAFADEPMAGVPVAIVPDGQDLADDQLRSVATEVGTIGTVTPEEGDLRFRPTGREPDVTAAAIGSCLSLLERDRLAEESITLTLGSGREAAATEEEYSVEVHTDRRVSVELPVQQRTGPAVTISEVASALGLDSASLSDIGADLPLAQATGFGGTVYVPVNFLEHLSSASPSIDAIASLLDATDARRLCAFTFDTLAAETDVHARIFDPKAGGGEVAASGIAAAGCASYLRSNEAFDGDKGDIGFESGHFIDRPSTLRCEVGESIRVSGYGLTVLDGEMTIPAADSGDEIIEV